MKSAFRILFGSKPFQKRLAKFLVHPVTILAIATVAAVWLTNYYQHQAWINEKQFEVFRQGYAESFELVDDLSEVMSHRVFGLNRVIWVAKGTGTGELDEVWDEYYQSVVEWNSKLLSYKGRLTRLVGDGAADALGNWEDDSLTDASSSPMTIHGHFFVAHKRVREFIDCIRKHCSDDVEATALQAARGAVDELSVAVEEFIQRCAYNIELIANTSG